MPSNKAKVWKKGLSLCLAAGIVLTGCSSTKDAVSSSSTKGDPEPSKPASVEPSAKPLDPVTLKIMMPGDKPANWDEVKAEAEKRMEGSLNVKLDVSFVSWADIDQKERVAMAGGEEWDLMWDAPGWPHFEQFVSDGYYAPIDDLLQEYGPNLLANRPKEMFEASKIGGKLYGVPLEVAWSTDPNPFIFEIRKDIREKLGVTPIKSWDELKQFMYLAHEKMPEIPTFVPQSYDQYPLKTAYLLDAAKGNPQLRYEYQAIYRKGDYKTYYNIWDDPDPVIMNAIKERRQMVLDGVIPKDTLTLGNAEFAKGKAVVTNASDYGIQPKVAADLAAAVPGATAESFTLFDLTKKAKTSFLAHNFMAVPVTSKNKERAIMFLDWANSNQENYDLLAYGIEGKNWENTGEGTYKPISTNLYPWFPYNWIWNPKQDRIDSTMDPEALKFKKWAQNPENFTVDRAQQFLFDKKPVQNEITSLNALGKEYWGPIVSGAVDTDEYLAKFKEKAYDMTKIVQAEYQKQLDAFLAGSN